MGYIIDGFSGTISLRIKSKKAETVLNMLARSNVEIWDISKDEGGTLCLTTYPSGYKKILEMQKRSGLFETEKLKERGAPPFLRRIKKRYVLAAGLVLTFLLLQISSLFIWQINVSGNETVSSSEILAELKKQGVGIGTCRLKISHEFLSNRMLINIPELSWFTINTHGSRAEVMVREENPAPELENDEPSDVYAAKGGIITGITAIGGKETVTSGETVAKGDILITGDLRNEEGKGLVTHGAGEVTARTWYEFSASMPLEALEKTYTGEEKTRKALILGEKRINLYFSGGNYSGSYDKITKYNTLTIPNGAVLPVTVVEETYSQYVTEKKQRKAEDAALVLKARLLERVKDEIGGGGILSTDYTVTEKNGIVTVTLYAECEEQIGEIRPLEVKQYDTKPFKEE